MKVRRRHHDILAGRGPNPITSIEALVDIPAMAKRQYKLGILGKIFALSRASLPVSLFYALILYIKHTNLTLFISKLVSDLGVFVGLIELITANKTAR